MHTQAALICRLLFEYLTNGVVHCIAKLGKLKSAAADGKEKSAKHNAGKKSVGPRKCVKRACEEI